MGKRDLYAALILLAFSGLTYLEAYSYPQEAAYFPRTLIILLAVLSFVLLVKSIFAGKREKVAGERPLGADAPPFWKKEVVRKVFLMVAVSVVYFLIMSSVGFYLTTLVYLPVMTWLLGFRKIKVIALSTVIVLFFIYLVFSAFLKVPIPEGIAF